MKQLLLDPELRILTICTIGIFYMVSVVIMFFIGVRVGRKTILENFDGTPKDLMKDE